MTAEDAEIEVSRLHSSGEWLTRRPRVQKTPDDQGVPVVLWQLVQRWIDHLREEQERRRRAPGTRRGISPGTLRNRINSANRLLYETHGRRRRPGKPCDWRPRPIAQLGLGELSESALQRHVDRRLESGAAPNTVAAEAEVFWLASKWGAAQGWCAAVPRFRLDRTRHRERITPEDAWVVELLPYLRQRGSGWSAIAALVCHQGGLRIGEVAHLRLDQVREVEDVIGPDQTRTLLLLDVQVSKTGARQPIIADPATVAAIQSWISGPRRTPTVDEELMLAMAERGRVRVSELVAAGWGAGSVYGCMRRLVASGQVAVVARLANKGTQFPTAVYQLTDAGQAAIENPPQNPSPYLLGVTPKTAKQYGTVLDMALADCNAARAQQGLPEIPRWTSHAHRRRSIHATIATGQSDPAAHKAQYGNSWEVAVRDYIIHTQADTRRVAGLVPALPELDNVVTLDKRRRG